MTGTIEARLEALGITLPPAPRPIANYVPSLVVGSFLYVSGQLSRDANGAVIVGRLGADLTVAEGQAAARLAALNIFAHAAAALGSVDRIVQVCRLTGFVNAAPEFAEHPLVINGASDLFIEVLGEAGRHTRSAVGAAGLPANAAVEIDAIFSIRV